MDTTPTAQSVSLFATHLLAEIEQVAMNDKRMSGGAAKGDPKIRAFEADSTSEGKKEREEADQKKRTQENKDANSISPTVDAGKENNVDGFTKERTRRDDVGTVVERITWPIVAPDPKEIPQRAKQREGRRSSEQRIRKEEVKRVSPKQDQSPRLSAL